MQKFKRLLPMLLALLILFTCLYTPVSAAIGETVTYSYRTAYQGGNKANGDYKVDGFNIDVLTIHGGSYDGRIAYCINRGARYISPDRTVTAEGTNLQSSEYWTSLSVTQQTLLRQLMPHIYPALSPAELGVSSVDDAYAASQVLLWDITEGYRDANGNLTNATLRDSYLAGTPALTAYNNIDAALRSHSVHTSWDKSTVTLQWNDANKRYEGTITDRNNVLGQFAIPSSVGSVNLSRSGNTLTLWSTTAIEEPTSNRFYKAFKTAKDTGTLAIIEKWGDDPAQEMLIAGCLDDPVYSDLAVETTTGTLRIKKTTTVPGGRISNLEFSIQNDSWMGGVPQIYKTDSQGVIAVDLPPGMYTVREVTVMEGVEQPAAQTKSVQSGKTTEFSFVNKPSNTTFKIRKFDPVYGNVANIPFRIEQTESSVAAYNWYYRVSTNAYGEAEITSEAVTAYYQSFIDSYTGSTARAQAIYRDVFGTTDYDATRMAVINRALLTVNSGLQLRVTSATYDVYELFWAFPENGRTPAEYYEGWHSDSSHEVYDSIDVDFSGTDNILEFENLTQLTTWVVKKTSEDGKVNGIPFLVELLTPDGHLVSAHRMTTTSRVINGVREDGVIYSTNGSTGTWRFTELECEANGYVKQEPKIVFAEPNKVTTITFENWVSPVPTTLKKTSDSGNVSGFTFSIAGSTDWGKTVYMTNLVTDANGEIKVNLKPGTYTITEHLTAEQLKLYEQPESQTITITRGQASASVFFHNSYKPVPVRAIKTSDSGNVEGFILSCVGESDTGLPVDMTDLVTDENGYVDLLLYPGTYVWSEHLTEEQAKLYAQPAPQTITVLPGQEQVTVSFHNAYAPVPVDLRKISSNGIVDGFKFSIYTSTSVTLVEDNLYSHDGGKIEKLNADGTYSPVELLPGTYYLYEYLTDEQKKVYVAPTGPVYFVVSEGSTSASAVFENTTKDITLYLYKYTEDMTNLGGFHFTLSEVTDAGNTILYDDLVSDNYGTIRRGDGSYPVALPGTYTLTEVLTPEQARVYQQLEPITFTVTDSDASAGYTRSITNKYIPGEISVVKQDRSGNTLAGAEYLLQISTDNGKTWKPVSSSQCSSVGLADGKLVTGEDGKVSFEGLKVNESTLYRLTETKAPEGCSLLTAPIFEGTLPMLGSSGLTRTPTFPVTDDVVLTLPHTGGDGFAAVTIMSALFCVLAAAIGSWLWINRRKSTDIAG